MPSARLSLGTARLGLPYGVASGGDPLSAGEVDAILETALDLGVPMLDTAPVYGCAEDRIGDFLRRRARHGEIAICTKLPPVAAAAGSEVGAFVAAAVESSRRRLGVERIDCYLVHHAGDLREHGKALVDALGGEQERGRIERIGISAYEPAVAESVLAYPPLSVVQHPLNLLDRRLLSSGSLGRLRDRGVRVHARSVFLQGLLSLRAEALPRRLARARPVLAVLRDVLGEWDAAPPDVAVAFAATMPGVERVVVGVDTPEQLRENVEALRRGVPDGLAEALAERIGDAPRDVVDPTRWPEEPS